MILACRSPSGGCCSRTPRTAPLTYFGGAIGITVLRQRPALFNPRPTTELRPAMAQPRLIACVLLPFAAGYYLSYLFRSINALIASDLVAELQISAADLGLLTSVYFLVLATVQLPFGTLLDRYGPKTIQSALLLLASAGALIFALAEGLVGLIVGRAMLSLGVALGLMAGFKAIVLW